MACNLVRPLMHVLSERGYCEQKKGMNMVVVALCKARMLEQIEWVSDSGQQWDHAADGAGLRISHDMSRFDDRP